MLGLGAKDGLDVYEDDKPTKIDPARNNAVFIEIIGCIDCK